MKLRVLYLFLSIFLFISCDECFLKKKTDILALVNGKCIDKRYFLLKLNLYDVKIDNYEQGNAFLNFIINNNLILQQAKKDGIKITKDEMKQEIKNFVPEYSEKEIKSMLKKINIKYNDWLADLKEKILIKKEIDFLVSNNIKIKDDELRDYFWSNIVKYRNLKKVKARQIVVSTREKAEEILIKLKNGADFEKLAKEYSITSEGEKGGDLGYFGEKDMPVFITKSVFALKKGEVSNIIESKYGFHIFKCEDIIEARTPEFEEVRDKVYSDFLEIKRDNYFNILMKNLRKNGKIVINEENLKKLINDMKEVSG